MFARPGRTPQLYFHVDFRFFQPVFKGPRALLDSETLVIAALHRKFKQPRLADLDG